MDFAYIVTALQRRGFCKRKTCIVCDRWSWS